MKHIPYGAGMYVDQRRPHQEQNGIKAFFNFSKDANNDDANNMMHVH